MRQPSCPSGLADRAETSVWWRQGSPTWASVGGRRVSPATSGTVGSTCGWCQASPTWLWVGGRRASCLPVGSSLAWAWATAVMAARVMAASVTATMRARVPLDMVVLGSVSWRCVGGRLAGRRPRLATGPTATSDETAATGAGGAADQRHARAGHGRPAPVVP
jgi:hypothetical protein